MEKQNKGGEVFFLGPFLALGLALAGYFISQTLYKAKTSVNTAEVKGLAERLVKSDRASWSITYSVAGKNRGEVSSLYKLMETHKKRIYDLLIDTGLTKEDISLGSFDYRLDEYRDDSQRLVEQKHIILGEIMVDTDKVDQVIDIRSKVSSLISEINIRMNAPKYHYTKLNDIKPEMLREATKDARDAANEFAKNAQAKVGAIKSARQGIFTIRDAGESYGDDRKLNKKLRVVTTVEFYLK